MLDNDFDFGPEDDDVFGPEDAAFAAVLAAVTYTRISDFLDDAEGPEDEITLTAGELLPLVITANQMAAEAMAARRAGLFGPEEVVNAARADASPDAEAEVRAMLSKLLG